MSHFSVRAHHRLSGAIVCCAVLCCVYTRSEYYQSDLELLDTLNELRLGRMTERMRCLLSECKRPLPDDGIGATHLFPRNEDVSAIDLHACGSLSHWDSMQEPTYTLCSLALCLQLGKSAGSDRR
jgi:hypothetical protein